MKKYLIFFFLFLSFNLFSQQIYIPNAFTPDGDGQNDYFGVFCLNKDSVQYFSMNIFNSHGQCVFKTNDIDDKWMGGDEYFGSPKTFVYYIEYKFIGSIEVNRRKGFVSIIR